MICKWKVVFTLILFYGYEYIACLYVYVPCVCLVHKEARKGYQLLWNRSYISLLAPMWMLGLEPRSSGRTASSLNH